MKPEKIYYIFVALQGIAFFVFATTYVPFARKIGLSLSEISLINAAFWATIIIMELPTGMLADGNSRSWAIKIALVLELIGFIVYGVASNFWHTLIAEITIGLSFTFLSGIDKAWITDALERSNSDKQPIQVFGAAIAIRGIIAIPSAIVGSLIGAYSLRMNWFISAGICIVTLIFVVKYMNGQGEPIHKVSEKEALKRSIACLKSSPALIWVIIATIIFGFCNPFNHYWIPYFKDEIPQEWLGCAFAVIYAPCAIGGCIIQKMYIKRKNEASIIIVSLILTGLGIATLSVTPGIILPLFFIGIHEIGRGTIMPVTSSFIQHRIKTEFRATYGSLHSLISRLGNGGFLFLTALYMQGKSDIKSDIGEVFLIIGISILIGSILLFFLRPRE